MFDEDNYYDYDSIAKDADDLYHDDDYDFDDIENVDEQEWENYYHNLTDEIIDE
jgi:hypothetical protein